MTQSACLPHFRPVCVPRTAGREQEFSKGDSQGSEGPALRTTRSVCHRLRKPVEVGSHRLKMVKLSR